MTDGANSLPTKERLARELEKMPPVNGLERLVKRARAGMYDDYESPLATPQMQLVVDLRSIGLHSFTHRVMNGEFDGTEEEAQAWRRSPEGERAITELLFGHKMPKHNVRACAHCGKKNDESVGTDSNGPQPGDASLCLYCMQWSIFSEEMDLRKPTEQEMEELRKSPVAMQAERTVKRVVHERGLNKDQ